MENTRGNSPTNAGCFIFSLVFIFLLCTFWLGSADTKYSFQEKTVFFIARFIIVLICGILFSLIFSKINQIQKDSFFSNFKKLLLLYIGFSLLILSIIFFLIL